MYEERTYREWIAGAGFVRSVVVEGESDLLILARRPDDAAAHRLVRGARDELNAMLRADPDFGAALTPHRTPSGAPSIAQRMAAAAERVGVGPMAAVAGAVAERVGAGLIAGGAEEVIVENGGDIFLQTRTPVTVSLYAGERSPFTGTLRFTVRPEGRPLGLCTSSGTVGHSTSFGRADALCIIARDVLFADAAATAFANEVRGPDDVDWAVQCATVTDGIDGILVAAGDRLGLWGAIELQSGRGR